MRRYYEILGVSQHASQQEIKDAWLREIDAVQPAQVSKLPVEQQRVQQLRFEMLNEAYRILSNEETRKDYDLSLKGAVVRRTGPVLGPQETARPSNSKTNSPAGLPPRRTESREKDVSGSARNRKLLFVVLVALVAVFAFAYVYVTRERRYLAGSARHSLASAMPSESESNTAKQNIVSSSLLSSAESSGEDRPLDLLSLASKARRAVVLIVCYDGEGKPIKSGSGFFISADGRLVTNWHVVNGISAAQAKLENGAIYSIDGVLASSSSADLAVLKADARDVDFLAMDESSDPPDAGTRVAVVGSPLGLENTLSEGIVSANREDETGRWLQITAPISPGSSGSPVLNRRNHVIGVATLNSQGRNQNLNFARSISDLKTVLRSISAHAKPTVFAPERSPDVNDDPEFMAAKGYNEKEDGAHALDLLNRVAQRFPDNDQVLFERGLALAYLGLSQEAFAAFRTYVKEHPTVASAWSNMAVAALRCSSYKEALNDAREAIRLNPKGYRPWLVIADVYEHYADFDSDVVRRTANYRLATEALEKAKALKEQEKAAEERARVQWSDNTPSNSPSGSAQPTSIGAVVTARDSKGLYVRADHSAKAAIIATVHHGDRIFLENEEFVNEDPPERVKWQKITSDGLTGWIRSDYISPEK